MQMDFNANGIKIILKKKEKQLWCIHDIKDIKIDSHAHVEFWGGISIFQAIIAISKIKKSLYFYDLFDS